MNPTVTIIVLNWNGKDLTLSCLESLSKVTYQNASVLLVDNGSSDGSIEAIKEKFPQVDILGLDKNYGYAGGNNRGYQSISENSTDFVCFLNNDTEVAPNFIDKLVDASKKLGNNNLFGPKIYYAGNPGVIWYAGGIVKLPLRIYHRGIRKADSEEFSKVIQTDYVTGCCLFTSWETINNLKGFDESFGMYSEDVDLCLRAKKLGLKSYFIPSARVWHKVSASLGGAFTFKKILRRLKSNLRLIKKYGYTN
ncbi:MAG: glycosyltransferase family 2 protein [Candidatus Marinimicrobia bacterium]|nr:glycosyltransferase family 2 protein [Candidatus Neomarinimicrobiota bacterium]MBL7023459.1 glycosyltransferase family 2 protein [Candidatus Neomarinimicrobiota bacterium]MBL7109286.1 glycosyltransferase family 2 protein [Candidatus Neomarinimicrobiota bacterium]